MFANKNIPSCISFAGGDIFYSSTGNQRGSPILSLIFRVKTWLSGSAKTSADDTSLFGSSLKSLEAKMQSDVLKLFLRI